MKIPEVSAALMPSDYRSVWASESAHAYKSKVKMCVPVHPMSVF